MAELVSFFMAFAGLRLGDSGFQSCGPRASDPASTSAPSIPKAEGRRRKRKEEEGAAAATVERSSRSSEARDGFSFDTTFSRERSTWQKGGKEKLFFLSGDFSL